MTTIEDLLRHAERCDRLSEICTDLTIAEKLRQLAGEYRELATHQPRPFKARLDAPKERSLTSALQLMPDEVSEAWRSSPLRSARSSFEQSQQ